MFANMKIGTRLGIGFGMLVLLMAAISFIGITRLGTVNNSLGDIVEDKWPKAQLANAITAGTNEIAIAMRNMLLTTDKSQEQKEIDRVMAARKLIGEKIDRLTQIVTTPRGKELLRKIQDERGKFIAGQDKLIALAGAEKDEEAKLFMAKELRPILRAYQDNIAELVKFQGELVDESGKVAEQAFIDARRLMIMLSIAALVLAAVTAFWVTHSITRPLKAAVDVADQLAHGDLTVKIDDVERRNRPDAAVDAKHVDKLSQVVSEVNGGAEALAGAVGRGERDRPVAVAGGERAGRGRGGDERVDGADDGVDLAEHREREGHRRHGTKAAQRGQPRAARR